MAQAKIDCQLFCQNKILEDASEEREQDLT
jgi:hypothetical protein